MQSKSQSDIDKYDATSRYIQLSGLALRRISRHDVYTSSVGQYVRRHQFGEVAQELALMLPGSVDYPAGLSV